MAKRGDVLVSRRRLGFGAEGRKELFVVVQADLLSGMETVVVAPLDDDAPMYDADPLAVHVSGKEAGTRSAQVVVVHLLAALSVQKFEALPAGRLTSRSISELEGVLRTVLQL